MDYIYGVRSRMAFGLKKDEGDPALEELKPVGGGVLAWPWDVDEAGAAVGTSLLDEQTSPVYPHAVEWPAESGEARLLPNLRGEIEPVAEAVSHARAISRNGRYVVGHDMQWVEQEGGGGYYNPRAVVWVKNRAAEEAGIDPWEVFDLNERVPEGWVFGAAHGVSDEGLILVQGHRRMANGNWEPRAALLVPMEMAVDANRDGVIKFAGNNTSPQVLNKAYDETSNEKPFRFWINDDNDGTVASEEDVIPATVPDYQDGIIKSRRDLEDFARLQVYVGGLQEVLESGSLKLAFEWRDTEGSSPKIKLYRATDIGTKYLEDSGTAMTMTMEPFRETLGEVSVDAPLYMPEWFWTRTSPYSNVPKTLPSAWLLFEGSGEGKGRLVLSFWKGNQRIGESAGVWLDLKNIKKMYIRSDQENQYAGDAEDVTEDTIVFVHGWRMSPAGKSNFAETFYKRLWHRGFKGRYAAFQWNTFWNEDHQWVKFIGPLDAYLSKYNDSEKIAWESAEALKMFVNHLPGERKHMAAHSMGNIVASEAIRLGMNVNNYALMQAAVPAAAYDEHERTKQRFTFRHRGRIGSIPTPIGITVWDKQTPDDDPDEITRALAYRGRFKDIGFNTNLINFFLPQDYATFMAWEINNDQTKPEEGLFSANFRYRRNNPEGEKLYKYKMVPYTGYRGTVYIQQVDYYLTDPYEAMAHACSTWGKALGAQNVAQGAITEGNNIGLNDPRFQLPDQPERQGFYDQHSGQFNARIQNLKAFYDEIINKFEVGPPNP